MIRNLGQVAAIYIGSSQPTNTNLIWLDNTVVPYAFRAYNGSTWSELATRDWVKMFVDGWLITLPPSTQAGDTDYILINSNNVNYKITVKEFVKSAVGNPLDFKGVIRTDADFPNPANCEAGDMYVIITSPAGGTVTDPYSGQMFEDTEKIVWDEVTKSWESLGKIQITVDLSTDYSATNVTINSSAGKGTTINAASTSLAGVMLPQQVKFLAYLSNGSTVPGEPSELDPDTPAHKHNYGDILNRLISQQEMGDSTYHPMSQKVTTDNLNLKFDKANVVQVQGAATDMVMSQKAVTDALKTLSDDFNNKLTNYLPLAGGTMKGSIRFPAESGIIGNADGTSDTYILRSFNNRLDIGAAALSTRIISNASDLLHHRLDTSYKMWDAYNLPNPATQNWVTSQGYYKSGSSSPLFTSGVYLAANAGTEGWARGYWIGNTNSASTSGVAFGGYGNGDTPSYAYICVGTNLSYSAVNNLKVYTDKVTFGNKTLATVDQIPTIPSISITTSGSGSVVTGISASGHTLTVTKGSASVSVSWNDITGKPSSFTPSAHTHEYIVGKYTGSGGVIAPGSIGTYKLQCNMMYVNAESSGGGYCDWILMNAYSWSDVPYATAIGVVKAATPSAYIMSGPNSTDKSTWVRKKLATTDEIPTIPSITISNSGSGNAVTAITASGHTLTVTKGATYLTSSSLSGYATQSWVTSQGYLTSSSLSGYATQEWANGRFLPLSGGKLTGDLSFQEANGIILRPSSDSHISGIFADTQGNECVAVWAKNTVTRLRWHAGIDMSDGTANSMMGITPDFEITKASGTAIGKIAGNEILHSNNYTSYTVTKTGGGASGTWGISISGNATTATTASKLGSTTIGGSAKPIYLSSGTPTACSATVGSATVPVYMNAGTITQCSTTLGVSITGNAATATNSTQLGGTAASSYVKANDNISRLTNDSGYATQEWVNSQNFVKSTSTKKVTDIQVVDALPATQASGVLYLVVK